MSSCKHCNIEFDVKNIANHSRWCHQNPKRRDYIESLKKIQGAKLGRKGKNHYSYGAVCSKETKNKLKIAAMGRKHTNESKKKMSEIALKQTHRRLKKNIVEYKGVILDSSWEFELAKRLDELEIKWIRPNPIPWIDDCGIVHNYFPDFYLPEHNLFLDPKNSHAIKVQNKKLKSLLTQYSNILIIDSLEKCKNFAL